MNLSKLATLVSLFLYGPAASDSRTMTANEFIEDLPEGAVIYDPAVYIRNFIPEITYSPSVGFTVTNFSALLSATNTTPDKWSIGILYYHKSIHRSSKARFNNDGIRHFRTTWDKFSDDETEGYHKGNADIKITSSNGVVSNSNIQAMSISGDDALKGQTTVLLGVRIRYNKNIAYRSKYSNRLYQPGTSTYYPTANYIQ